MGYIAVQDLTGATTQYLSALGSQGVDFSRYGPAALAALIEQVSSQIDGYCGQTFRLTNVTERHVGRGSNTLRLRRYPLAQVVDSIFGVAAGSVSQSLVVDTTTSAPASHGQATVSVVDGSAMLAGQYLGWGDDSGEALIEITRVSGTGPYTITLASNLVFDHASGARVVVNSVDFAAIAMPNGTPVFIPTNQLLVDAPGGRLLNYTPLIFQYVGYTTVFPKSLPIVVRYTYGYPPGQYPDDLKYVTMELCRRTALLQAHLGAAGVAGTKLDDQEVRYQKWMPCDLDEDLKRRLQPYNRFGGFA